MRAPRRPLQPTHGHPPMLESKPYLSVRPTHMPKIVCMTTSARKRLLAAQQPRVMATCVYVLCRGSALPPKRVTAAAMYKLGIVLALCACAALHADARTLMQ